MPSQRGHTIGRMAQARRCAARMLRDRSLAVWSSFVVVARLDVVFALGAQRRLSSVHDLPTTRPTCTPRKPVSKSVHLFSGTNADKQSKSSRGRSQCPIGRQTGFARIEGEDEDGSHSDGTTGRRDGGCGHEKSREEQSREPSTKASTKASTKPNTKPTKQLNL